MFRRKQQKTPPVHAREKVPDAKIVVAALNLIDKKMDTLTVTAKSLLDDVAAIP